MQESRCNTMMSLALATPSRNDSWANIQEPPPFRGSGLEGFHCSPSGPLSHGGPDYSALVQGVRTRRGSTVVPQGP